jgi:hypothetical protein
MRRMTTVSLVSIAALALGGLTAGSASAAKLTLSNNGEPLPHGYEFFMSGEEGPISTPDGPISCAFNGEGFRKPVRFEVLTNEKPTDEVAIITPKEVIDETGLCGGEVHGHNRVVFITATMRSPLKLRASGKATLEVQWEMVTAGEQREEGEALRCVYDKRPPATNDATETPQELGIGWNHTQRLDKAESEGAECPKEFSASFTFDLTENYEGEGGTIDEQTSLTMH